MGQYCIINFNLKANLNHKIKTKKGWAKFGDIFMLYGKLKLLLDKKGQLDFIEIFQGFNNYKIQLIKFILFYK